MANLQAEAWKLAKQGTPVFPLKDKKPIVAGGFHSASTERDVIKEQPWQQANGIGAAIPEGTFVVDIDVQHGGDETIDALREAGLSLPRTKTHSTRSGGWHQFYRLPPEYQQDDVRLKGKLGPGVDIKRAGKGYVVMPPTEGYSVFQNGGAVEAPTWVMEEIVKPEVDKKQGSMGGLPKFFDLWQDGTDYGVAAMKSELENLAGTPVGERNNALNKAAFAMAQLVAGGELAEGPARDKLTAEGERYSDKPGEVEQTIQSGWEAGLQEPRESSDREVKGDDVEVGHSDFGPPEQDHEELFWLDWENADDSPPPFYLHPILPKNAYVIVYGATEASKSIVLLHLASEASHHGLKSSVYSLENPTHIDVDRVKRISPNPSNFRISNQMLDLNEARQVHALVEREKEWGADLVIIDTYSHAFNSRTEDGNAKAIEFARRIRWIMRKVGCTVVIVDHTGYADHGEPRDASAKRQQVDVAIKMDRPVPWSPGQPAHFSMECTKAARFGNPFYKRGMIEDGPNRKLILNWANGHEPEWRT